jgi:DNA-directed RNA polymerase subunit M/transcription elongation factor TFIIS
MTLNNCDSCLDFFGILMLHSCCLKCRKRRRQRASKEGRKEGYFKNVMIRFKDFPEILFYSFEHCYLLVKT